MGGECSDTTVPPQVPGAKLKSVLQDTFYQDSEQTVRVNGGKFASDVQTLLCNTFSLLFLSNWL